MEFLLQHPYLSGFLIFEFILFFFAVGNKLLQEYINYKIEMERRLERMACESCDCEESDNPAAGKLKKIRKDMLN